MPSSRLTIAGMGLEAYLDGTAHMHNGKDYAWFVDAVDRLDADQTTKKEIYETMEITPVTLDKYILLRNIEQVKHGN